MNALAPTRAAHFDRFFSTKIERLDNDIAMLERRLPYEEAQLAKGRESFRATVEATKARIRRLKQDRYNAAAFKSQ